jgi:hypothetical protein
MEAYRRGNSIYAHSVKEGETFLHTDEFLWHYGDSEEPMFDGLYYYIATKEEHFMPKEMKLDYRKQKRKEKHRNRWN